MAAKATYALIIRPDQHSAGHHLATCPDIPGWFAVGDSVAQASKRGEEIIQGIIAERQRKGVSLPTPIVQTKQVIVESTSPPASSSEEGSEKPLSDTTLASTIARSREPSMTEEDHADDGKVTFLSSEVVPGRVLKTGN